MERDLAEVHKLGLKLAYTVDTHIHADHITAALEMKRAVGSKIAAPAYDRLACADVGLKEGIPFKVAGITLHPLHTAGHFAYLIFLMSVYLLVMLSLLKGVVELTFSTVIPTLYTTLCAKSYFLYQMRR